MKEIWKKIDNYEGYEISNFGRIRTHNKITHTDLHGARKWKDKILKPKISQKDKCARIELWKNGEHKTFLVHRLVANAFLEKMIGTEMTVNHKDGNRLNNRVDNLEWLSRADNIKHGFNNNLYSTQVHCALTDKNGNIFNFRSLSEASKYLQRSHSYISDSIKKGRNITDKIGNSYIVTF